MSELLATAWHLRYVLAFGVFLVGVGIYLAHLFASANANYIKRHVSAALGPERDTNGNR